MESPVGLLEVFRSGMGVYLGSSNITMAKKLLHAAEVCPTSEHVRGEAMAQCMHFGLYARKSAIVLEAFPDQRPG
jgi:hypothetical protein